MNQRASLRRAAATAPENRRSLTASRARLVVREWMQCRRAIRATEASDLVRI